MSEDNLAKNGGVVREERTNLVSSAAGKYLNGGGNSRVGRHEVVRSERRTGKSVSDGVGRKDFASTFITNKSSSQYNNRSLLGNTTEVNNVNSTGPTCVPETSLNIQVNYNNYNKLRSEITLPQEPTFRNGLNSKLPLPLDNHMGLKELVLNPHVEPNLHDPFGSNRILLVDKGGEFRHDALASFDCRIEVEEVASDDIEILENLGANKGNAPSI